MTPRHLVRRLQRATLECPAGCSGRCSDRRADPPRARDSDLGRRLRRPETRVDPEIRWRVEGWAPREPPSGKGRGQATAFVHPRRSGSGSCAFRSWSWWAWPTRPAMSSPHTTSRRRCPARAWSSSRTWGRGKRPSESFLHELMSACDREAVPAVDEQVASGRIDELFASLSDEDRAHDRPSMRFSTSRSPWNPAWRRHRAFRPAFDQSQKSSRLISRSRIRRLSACGQSP